VSSLRDDATRTKKAPAKVGKKLVLWIENQKNPAIADGIFERFCVLFIPPQSSVS
jgi:hypothetical protein